MNPLQHITTPSPPPHFSLQLTPPPESFIGPCLAPEADVIEIVTQLLEELLGIGQNLWIYHVSGGIE